jgi:branched-chain amino acid transport system ATP-binding protein
MRVSIEVRNLTAGYRSLEVVKGIDLHVDKGEVVTVLGPNGSGKTTLLRAIVGVIEGYGGQINGGQVLLNGSIITGRKPHELLKMGVAFVPDGGKVFPSMTVRENLQMGGFILREKREIEKRISEVLEIFPILGELISRRAVGLSGGERQILSLAKAMVTKPEFLILDEPSAGLSPGYTKTLFAKLTELKRESGILVVEQNSKVALEYSDRGYVIRHGKVDLEGKSDELLKREDVFKLL